MLSSDDSAPKHSVVSLAWKRVGQLYQKTLDDSTPHVAGRWCFAGLLVIIFLCRVFIVQVCKIKPHRAHSGILIFCKPNIQQNPLINVN